MAFACIYIPDFLVQSAVRAQPALGSGALVLLGGAPPLWSVVAANQQAFQAGIQIGMTKAQVAQFASPVSDVTAHAVPSSVGARDSRARSASAQISAHSQNVQISLRSKPQEKSAHAALLDAAWSISPRVEDTAPDTILLDLDGLTTLFGTHQQIADELSHRVASIGLIPRIAISSNIETAIHAARGFPGITIIPAGEERQRLASLHISILVTAPETLEIFERWGIGTFEALAALPVLQLSERLGQQGVRLSELARGVSLRSLLLAQPLSYFVEEMELDDAVEDLEPLSFLLGRLLDQLCARLEARALAIHAIRLRFELQPSFEKDFQALKEAIRRKPPLKYYEKLLTLPVPIRNPKTLLKLLRLQLQGAPPPAPIQKIYMAADSAAPRVAQSGLFVPRGPDPEKLEVTLARLEKLVGEGNLGSPELLDSHRPECFRMQRFAVTEHNKRRGKNDPATKQNLVPSAPVTALREMRPPQPIHVELRNNQPAAVYLHGIRTKVKISSGPWRISGDWWQEDSWRQEEWDLELEFPGRSQQHAAELTALYRIFFDTLKQSWFLRGEYD